MKYVLVKTVTEINGLYGCDYKNRLLESEGIRQLTVKVCRNK